MAVVDIAIKKRIATAQAGVILVCNNPTDTLRFEFDEEWNDHTARVARFVWGHRYVDIPFAGNTVKAPEITDTLYVEVGVYADDIATTPVRLECKRSILCLANQKRIPMDNTDFEQYKDVAEEFVETAKQYTQYEERLSTIEDDFSQLKPPDIGALPTTGGNMTGSIRFEGNTQGLVWQTANGTFFSMRPYTDGNLFQITVRGPGTNNEERPTFNIHDNGFLALDKALPISSGGTGASDAVGARANLGAAELQDGIVLVVNQKGIGTGTTAGLYWQLWNLQDGNEFPAGLCPTLNGKQILGHDAYRIKEVYANNYPCGSWNGNPIALNKGGLGRAFASEAELRDYLKGLLGI